MAVHAGLVALALIVKGVLGTVVVVAAVIFLWKLGKLVDTYTDKLKEKSQ